MEALRIRIPKVYYCEAPKCKELIRFIGLCAECELHAWMRQEMAATTLTSQPKIIHSTPLRRYLSG